MPESESVKLTKAGYSVVPERDYKLTSSSRLPFVAYQKEVSNDEMLWYRKEFMLYCKQNKVNFLASAAPCSFILWARKNFPPQKFIRLFNVVQSIKRGMSKVEKLVTGSDLPVKFESVTPPDLKDECDYSPLRAPFQVQSLMKKILTYSALRRMGRVVQLEMDVLTKRDVVMATGSDSAYSYLSLKGDALKQLFHSPPPLPLLVSYYNFSLVPADYAEALLPSVDSFLGFTIDRVGEFVGPDFKIISTSDGRGSFSVGGVVKGRHFYKECWYPASYWKRNFCIMRFPNDGQDLYRSFLLVAKKIPPSPMAVRGLEPDWVLLRNNGVATKAEIHKPKAYPICQTKESEEDFVSIMRYVTIAQTSKIDGLSFSLIVNHDGRVEIMDRMGIKYYADWKGANLVCVPGEMIQLDVEGVFNHEGTMRMKLYANAVVHAPLACGDDNFLTELVKTVNELNRRANFVFVGMKEYVVTCGQVAKVRTDVPKDGAVYIPLLCNSQAYPIIGHSYLKPFASTDIDWASLNGGGTELLKVLYRHHDATLEAAPPYSATVERNLRDEHRRQNDYDERYVVPLLYEGHYYPPGLFDERGSFVVTHVRGDKAKFKSNVDQIYNPNIATGKLAFTRFGTDLEDVALGFLRSFSSSRVIKMMPKHLGVTGPFIENFMKAWQEGKIMRPLNEYVKDGLFTGPYTVFRKVLMTEFHPFYALLLMDTLFRYASVKHHYKVRGAKVETFVDIDLKRTYAVKCELSSVLF